MAYRIPTRDDVTPEDAERLQVAMLRCLYWLERDLRVEAAVEAWLDGRAIARLERQFAAWQTPAASDALHRALFTPPTDAEVATLAQVLTGMGLPWTWPARQLLTMAPWSYVNAHRAPGSDPVVFASPRAQLIVPPTSAGRRARDAAARIELGVDEWYHWKIRVPRKELHELEAEDEARTGRKNWKPENRRHSSVLARVKQAEALLADWQDVKSRPLDSLR